MKKKLPPERKPEQKWIEQFSDENLNWYNIIINQSLAGNKRRSTPEFPIQMLNW